MRRIQVLRGGVIHWENVPDQAELDRAFQQGIDAWRLARRHGRPPADPDPRRVLAEAEHLLSTLTPDPPELIAERQAALHAM